MAHELPDQSDLDVERELAARIEARISRLDLVSEFEATGSPYSELDENGQVVTRVPTRSPNLSAESS